MQFAAGNRVGVRGLAWDVLDVQPLGAQSRLRLRCAAGDLRGLEWDVLHPLEPVTLLQAALRPEAPGPLTAWRLHHIACLLDQIPEAGTMLAADPGRLTVEPYQLVPLMRALEMPRPRLLLADAVGLGKTIQAGLIATELIARRRAHRILVVAPPGPLLAQWHYELRDRFALRFTTIADSAALQRERRRTELGGNPFHNIALCLVSLDFAKQERVLEELERAAWDLAIIDEAHHCIAAGTDTEATLRRRLAELLARRADGLLLLTATPHDGYDAHFASLIALLDPSLVDGRGGLIGTAYRRHVVRRLKSHIRNPSTGAPMFRERKILPVRIEPRGHDAAAAQAFHGALAALVAPRLRRAQRGGGDADALAFIGLLKRSVSTISACVATLQVVAERYGALRADATDAEPLRQERARALRAYRRRRLRFGVLDAAAETAAEALEAEDMAAALCRSDAGAIAAESRLLNDADATLAGLHELVRLGTAAAPSDPKLRAMADEIRLIRAAQPGANILVYTEYADSQAAAEEALRHARGITGEILAISGLDPEAERTRIAERCAAQDDIVLVSTDSMAEGLNLHQRCCHLIHLDLPYNPNRLEQRNGRIDRYGQRHEPQIRYLYLAGTFEERLLLRLIAKYEKARARLDVMPDTLGVTADAAAWSTGLIAGFAAEQAGLFAEDAPAIRSLDTAAETQNAAALRDLLHEIDRAFGGYERQAARHGWLAEQGLNADLRQVRDAEAAHRRSDALAGHVDLPDFVAAAIAAEISPGAVTTAARPTAAADPGVSPDRLTLPADWTVGLDGLPGYDAATRTLRFTRDGSVLCDADGAALAFLGRGHPLVQRAIARVRHSGIDPAGETCDPRVSVARGDSPVPAALLTFSIEIASPRHIALQRVVAILLSATGPAVEATPGQWLSLADADRAAADRVADDHAAAEHAPLADGVWQRWFAAWLPQRQRDAAQIAAATMPRIAAAFTAARQSQAERRRAALEHWLKLRADEICGAFLPRTSDLFGDVPPLPGWKSLTAPLDRLAAFTADPNNAPAARREANSAARLFQSQSEDIAADLTLSPPVLRPIGLLLLLPTPPAAAQRPRPGRVGNAGTPNGKDGGAP